MVETSFHSEKEKKLLIGYLDVAVAPKMNVSLQLIFGKGLGIKQGYMIGESWYMTPERSLMFTGRSSFDILINKVKINKKTK